MALLTKHVYANKLYAHLAASATSSQVTLTIYPEEITNLLASWEAGSWLYLCLMAPTGTVEIVKMTGLSGNTLTVARGQGGTTARAWAAGTLVASRSVAEYLTRFLQKGIYRSGAYNPNDTLTGEFTGEKFYQTGPAEGQKRWWICTTGTKWRLLTGAAYTYEVQDDDGYWRFMPIWTEITDPSYWGDKSNVVYDEANGWWVAANNSTGYLYATGAWYVGERWHDLRVAIQGYNHTLAVFSIVDQNNAVIDDTAGDPTYYCYEEQKLVFGTYDFKGIKWSYNLPRECHFKLYVNSGTPWEEFDIQYTDYTGPTYWEDHPGNGCVWDTDGWTEGTLVKFRLAAIGTWASAFRPRTVRVTTSDGSIAIFRLKNLAGDTWMLSESGISDNPFTLDICGYNNEDIYELESNSGLTGAKLTKIEFGEEQW